MTRSLPLLILLFALVVFFVAERLGVMSEHQGDGPVVVTFWAFSIPAQTMMQLKSEFEAENPDILVEVQTVPWESMQYKVLWAIAANSNVPDVIVGSSEWTGGLVESGALDPLDRHLEPEFFQRFFPTALGIYQFPEVDRESPGVRGRNRQYGVPLDLDMMLVFYRDDLLRPFLEQQQLAEFPATWEDFERLGFAVRDGTAEAGRQRQYLLTLDPSDPVPMSMAFLPAAGASFLDENLSRAVFNTPNAAEAFGFFGRLIRSNVALRWERALMEDPLVAYKTGQAIAYIAGPWYAKLLEKKAPELAGKWRVALFPRRVEGLPSCGLGGACLAMPYNAVNKREAVRLIRYMSSDKFALAYYERVGSPPPQVSAWNNPLFSQTSPYFGGQNVHAIVRTAIETARPLQLMPSSQIAKDPVRWAMREIALNGAPVVETLNEAVARANRILRGE